MPPQAKYIYGIIGEFQPRTFDFCGVENAVVYTIIHQELAVVVSDTEPKEIDPTRKNVLAHTVVQDKLLKEFDILPMGFGIIAGSADEVRRLLEKNYQRFVSELKRLSGKIEAELKVFWDPEAMLKELQGKNHELARVKAKINGASSPAEAQRLLLEAGMQVERFAQIWKIKYAEQIYAVLSTLSFDARLNNPLGVKNILNASFLIEKSRESEFQQAVCRLDSEYQGKINFKYVGPLPPYNFISLKLEPVK
jgi:hypothetical protein